MLGLGVGLDDAGQGPVARLIRDGALWAGDFRTQLYYADNEPVQIAGLFDLTNYRNSAAWRINTAGSLIAYAAGEPRVADGSLLVEEAGANLLRYSTDPDNNTVWVKVRVSVAANGDGVIDPSGNAAKKLLGTADNGTHFIYQNATLTGDRVISVFAKAAELSWLILVNAGFGVQTASFNLANGTVGTVVGFSDTSMTSIGGGWYRCSGTIPSSVPDGSFDCVFALGDGDNTFSFAGSPDEGIYIYGPQYEAGAALTSYIPTEATAVTRSAEVPLAKQGSGPIPYPGYVDGPGFLAATFKNVSDTGANRTVLSLSDGTTDEQVKVHVDASDDLILTANAAAGTPATATIASGIDLAAGGTVAVAYDATLVRASYNGGAVVNATKALDTSALTELHIACNEAGADQLNGEIVSTDAGDGTLTDAQLQAKAQ